MDGDVLDTNGWALRQTIEPMLFAELKRIWERIVLD